MLLKKEVSSLILESSSIALEKENIVSIRSR